MFRREERKVNTRKSRVNLSESYTLRKTKVRKYYISIEFVGQIQPRLKESFWEKIGFKNKKKEE
jgi:hypothetical protein